MQVHRVEAVIESEGNHIMPEHREWLKLRKCIEENLDISHACCVLWRSKDKFIRMAMKKELRNRISKARENYNGYSTSTKMERRKIREDCISTCRKQATRSANEIKEKWCNSFWSLLITTLVAFIIVGIYREISGLHTNIDFFDVLSVVGLFSVAWATMGRVGWRIMTWGLESLYERLDEWWDRSLFLFGVFLTITSLLAPSSCDILNN